MTCQGYSCSALVGNWFEERQADRQPSRMQPGKKVVRKDNDITFNSNGHQVTGLSKIGRKQKWNTKAITLDQGFREYTPLTSDSYRKSLIESYYGNKDKRPVKKDSQDAPRIERKGEHCQTSGSSIFKMVGNSNAHQIFEKRDFPMNNSDFLSTLKSHPDDHNRLYDMTVYRQSYARDLTNTTKDFVDGKRSLMGTGAGKQKPVGDKVERKKRSTMLIGEDFRDFEDPKQSVHVQRTWVYGRDKGLEYVEDEIEKALKTMDGKGTKDEIIASINRSRLPEPGDVKEGGDGPGTIPVEEGEHQFHKQMGHEGAYRRIRSDITRTRNQPLTFK